MAMSILPQGTQRSDRLPVAEAVRNVNCDLSYVDHLSRLLIEQADCGTPLRIEALAHAIHRISSDIETRLEQFVDAEAATASTPQQ